MAYLKAGHLKRNPRWRVGLNRVRGRELAAIGALRKVESVMSGLPLRWVGAVFFVIGCLPLLGYLVVIGYVPPNLLGIVGLASIASFWLLSLWVIMTVVMFGVTAVAFLYGVKNLDWRTTVLGQIGPLCFVVGLLFHSYGFWFSAPLVVCTLFALGWTVMRLLREQPRRSRKGMVLAVAALVFGGSLVSLAVFLVVAHSAFLGYRNISDSSWVIAVWAVAIAVLICANAAATHVRAAPLAIWFFCFVSSGLMVLALGSPSYVASLVAAKVGLRLPGTVELQVPMSTCIAVVAATKGPGKNAEAGPVTVCASPVNTLLVDAQLRWGDRWLVAVKAINGMRLPEPSVRVTIPDQGTELILR